MFYDFLEAAGADRVLEQYRLDEDRRRYRYLAAVDGDGDDNVADGRRTGRESHAKNFNKLLACMRDALEFTDEQLSTVWRVLAAILNVGELRVDDDGGGGDGDGPEIRDAETVANGKRAISSAAAWARRRRVDGRMDEWWRGGAMTVCVALVPS